MDIGLDTENYMEAFADHPGESMDAWRSGVTYSSTVARSPSREVSRLT